jgi:hypothetical protein
MDANRYPQVSRAQQMSNIVQLFATVIESDFGSLPFSGRNPGPSKTSAKSEHF